MATPKRTRKSRGGKIEVEACSGASETKRTSSKTYEESMLGAIKAVHEGTLGVNRAALEFAVPKQL